jgi:hypothetical protein
MQFSNTAFYAVNNEYMHANNTHMVVCMKYSVLEFVSSVP